MQLVSLQLKSPYCKSEIEIPGSSFVLFGLTVQLLLLLVRSGGRRVPARVGLKHPFHGGDDFVVTRTPGLSLKRVVRKISFFPGIEGTLEEGNGLSSSRKVVAVAAEAAAGAPLVEGVTVERKSKLYQVNSM